MKQTHIRAARNGGRKSTKRQLHKPREIPTAGKIPDTVKSNLASLARGLLEDLFTSLNKEPNSLRTVLFTYVLECLNTEWTTRKLAVLRALAEYAGDRDDTATIRALLATYEANIDWRKIQDREFEEAVAQTNALTYLMEMAVCHAEGTPCDEIQCGLVELSTTTNARLNKIAAVLRIG